MLLAIIQAATEFLPVSSSGHLALVSNLISQPNLFFITVLHLASLLAVLIFTRKEIALLLTFNKQSQKLWGLLIIATIPAALFGYFFSSFIEASFSSYLFLGFTFLFTGVVLLSTKNFKTFTKLNWKNSLAIGFAQVLALFPGVSRSGVTISTGKFLGLRNEQAFKFSFLLFIPLVLGAMVLESGQAYFSLSLLVSFILCFFLSLFFLSLLHVVLKRGKFWLLGFYCLLVSLVSFLLYFLL